MDGLLSGDGVQICIIFLAALVNASLQLGLGSLLLLYHASLGKHIKKKTKILASNYILGSLVFIGLMVAASSFIIATVAGSTLPVEVLSLLVVIMFILAVIIWFFYYQTKRSTELWLPRSVSRYISTRAKITESNTEAFSLGMLATFAEMPFSAVLMVVAGNSVITLSTNWLQILSVIGYTLIAILPLLVLRFCIRHGKTVVDIQKWRMKNKSFLKVMSGVGFVTLATFIIAFKIMG